MLKIKNLKAGIEEVQILKGINLEVKAGEVRLLWGLMVREKYIVKVVMGKEDYEVEDGSVDFLGEDLMDLDPEERSPQRSVPFFSIPYRNSWNFCV